MIDNEKAGVHLNLPPACPWEPSCRLDTSKLQMQLRACQQNQEDQELCLYFLSLFCICFLPPLLIGSRPDCDAALDSRWVITSQVMSEWQINKSINVSYNLPFFYSSRHKGVALDITLLLLLFWWVLRGIIIARVGGLHVTGGLSYLGQGLWPGNAHKRGHVHEHWWNESDNWYPGLENNLLKGLLASSNVSSTWWTERFF